MLRTFLAITGTLYLAGCVAPQPAPDAASARPFMLKLDKTMVAEEPERPATYRAQKRKTRKCRWVEIAGTRIRKKICEPNMDREHLRNAGQAGLRALRRSELEGLMAE